MEEFNYFNYYTEIEEHFWRKRGAHLLVSPLDWAILETWQKAGIPLDAVLRGIDRAFESYQRSRRGQAGRPLKSLVYCVDAVLEAAAEAKEAAAGTGPETGRAQPADLFTPGEIAGYFDRNVAQLRRAAEQARASLPELAARFEQTAASLAARRAGFAPDAVEDLEDLERWLTVLEEKLSAALTAAAPEPLLLELRRELDRALARYRRKMTAEQLSLLERQYLQKRLFEKFALPRLSLFYLT
jgi:hypothetical protein